MENIGFGLQITVLGMTIVFLLLGLLWALLSVVLLLDKPPAEEPEAEAKAPVTAIVPASAPAEVSLAVRSASNVGDLDPDLVAAILIAVSTHRRVRRLQAAPAMRLYLPGSLIYASRWVASGRGRQNSNWQPRRR